MALPGNVKRILWALAALTAAAGIWLGVSIYRSTAELTVTHYEIPAAVTEPIRIVQLSDLHSVQFGEDNAELIEQVAAQTPDLIFLTGDMLNRKGRAEDVAPLCDLVRRLAEIAPVYWADGNHERMFLAATGAELHTPLAEAGAVVLDDEYADVTVKGQQLRIGGYYGYYGVPHMITDDPAQEAAQSAFFRDFEDTDRLKLLLCHIPTAWVDWDYVNKYPVDVIFSGHYHGGQIRLPLIGGLYAPYVGFFPENTRGLFAGSRGVCVLSAGLGSEPGVPRVNNLPEIVVADLIPEEGGTAWKENMDTYWSF